MPIKSLVWKYILKKKEQGFCEFKKIYTFAPH
jgi:hypothetical protein